ncbi:MAG: hypothetical protein R2864_06330 [Syntrophotaleaceae bacterium]
MTTTDRSLARCWSKWSIDKTQLMGPFTSTGAACLASPKLGYLDEQALLDFRHKTLNMLQVDLKWRAILREVLALVPEVTEHVVPVYRACSTSYLLQPAIPPTWATDDRPAFRLRDLAGTGLGGRDRAFSTAAAGRRGLPGNGASSQEGDRLRGQDRMPVVDQRK